MIFLGCQDGHYGRDCMQKCGQKCDSQIPCDKVSGNCSKCLTNYVGQYCQYVIPNVSNGTVYLMKTTSKSICIWWRTETRKKAEVIYHVEYGFKGKSNRINTVQPAKDAKGNMTMKVDNLLPARSYWIKITPTLLTHSVSHRGIPVTNIYETNCASMSRIYFFIIL